VINLSNSLLSLWQGLRTPLEGRYTTKGLSGTNAYLFKDHNDSMGILLSGILFPNNMPSLENINIKEVREKHLVEGGTTTVLRNCLEIHLDASCDSELLLRILDAMQKAAPDGHYSAELLLTVIQQVIELVRRPPRPPTKEEVIGAWGEMEFLRRLVSRASEPNVRSEIIRGWEANLSGRDIIDLRFSNCLGGTAIEIKTSTGPRIHHINGIGQVTIPEGYERGYLASISISEGDDSFGMTAESLLDELKDLASGSKAEMKEYLSTLERKVAKRGNGCTDKRYFFSAGLESIRLIEMNEVAKPEIFPSILEVEWTVDVSSCIVDDSHLEEVFRAISGD